MRRITSCLVFAFLLCLPVGSASAATSESAGPQPFASIVDDATFGESPWSNPENAILCDDLRTETNLTGPRGFSHRLAATNPHFSIPTNATITGIEATLKAQSSHTGEASAIVRLATNGIPIGDSHARYLIPGKADTIYTMAGPSDSWGVAWTAQDLNSTTFGAVLWILGTPRSSVGIDCLSLTAYYAPPSVYYLPLLARP